MAGYTIWAHLPSHGARTKNAEYVIKVPGAQDATCVINQDVTQYQDVWVSLGVFSLKQGSRIQLSNMIANGDGTQGIAWDAMAFLDNVGATYYCGEQLR